MANIKPPVPFYTKLAMILVCLVAGVFIAIQGKNILAPLILSLFFALLLLPLARFWETRLRINRMLASLITVLIMISFFIMILFVIGSQFTLFAGDWPGLQQQLLVAIQDIQHWINVEFHVNMKKQTTYINSTLSQVFNAPSMIGSTLLSIGSILFFVVFIILDTFFFLFYRRLLTVFLMEVFKKEHAAMVYNIMLEVQSGIQHYIKGLLLEMVIVSGAASLMLYIIGVKYAILLGVLTGVLNVIPYVGIFTSILLSGLLALAAAGITQAILVILSLLCLHLVDANILLPLIVGRKVRLNALVTILGVVLGGSIWGIIGTFFAIPVIAIFKIIFDRVEQLKPWGMLLGEEKKAIRF